MDFAKTLKNYHIAYFGFPPADIKVEENTVIALPGEKKGQFKLYAWFENEWVYTAFIDKSDFDLKELKDAYDDLSNAVKKLTKIAANTENDELSSKLSKITTKILQAKYELSDDVIDQFEKTCDSYKDYKKMTLEKFIQVFCEYDKLNTDMCVIKYDGADYVSSEFKAYTKLSEIPTLTSISMDSKVCHAYYEDGCLFVEVES